MDQVFEAQTLCGSHLGKHHRHARWMLMSRLSRWSRCTTALTIASFTARSPSQALGDAVHALLPDDDLDWQSGMGREPAQANLPTDFEARWAAWLSPRSG